MMKIGFIGLGTMGSPMATNLLQAGYELFFYARRDPVVKQFVEAGAIQCGNCAEVARAADLIVTIVTADREVEQVILGEDGVIHGGDSGKLVIDMSTIGPATARGVAARLEAMGMSMLDAPVSGGPSGAKQGSLAIMVGGKEEEFLRARPVLDVLGGNIFHLGPVGAGQTAKLVNQMLSGGTMALIGEAMSLAKAAGLDLTQVFNVVSGSSGNSTMFSSRAQFVMDDHYPPGFKTELMRKDVALALSLAHELHSPAPMASVALQQYTSAVRRGDGTLDFAAVARLWEDKPE